MRTYKEINIRYYDINGVEHTRCTVPVTESALVHFELMQSHYCKLSFKLGKAVYFKLGDFIVTDYGRFELVDSVRPKDDGSLGYSYDLQLEAYYRKWKNKRMKYMPNSGSPEGTFTLTSNISTHANVVIDNLKFLASLGKSYLYDPNYEGDGTDYVFKVDESVDSVKAKTVTYSNSSILDAISNIAQTFECEWWMEGNIIHFGTCENTNAIVSFKDGENIVSMSSSQSQSNYANRVYAFGAARNLPSGYKQNESADVTKNGVVERRLMLPTLKECSDKNKNLLEENGFELKDGYIQVKGLTEDEYVEGVTTNDDIYPRNLVKTSNVTSYERDVEDESTPENGDFVKRTFYRVNDLSIVDNDGEKTGDMAFRSSYILSGKTLHIVFQSGSLNGMDFECQFNPNAEQEILRDDKGNPILKDGKEQINPESQVFEIVGNEDYGRFLPDTGLHPKDGDTFVLYNWDSTKLGTTLVTSSANELLTDSVKNLKKSMIDPTTYTCTASSDYTYNDGNGMFHQEGDRISLFNKGYGGNPRESRIIGYELHLDIPFDGVKYIIGEKPAYSRLNAMSSQIEELMFNGQSYVGQGGEGSTTYIIKSYDTVLPTEYNVYSAKAVDSQRANKVKDDTFQGFMRFLKGLRADEKIQLLKGLVIGNNGYSFDEDGNIIANSLKSPTFNKALNEGFGLEMEMGDQSHLYLANLTVWGKMMVNVLEIMKTKYAGGNIYLSAAGGTIVKAVPVYYEDAILDWVEADDYTQPQGWKCYFVAEDGDNAIGNPWKIGDQVRCQSIGNLLGENVGQYSNKSYWRTIADVSNMNDFIYGDGMVPLYNGKRFYWIVIGKHSKDFDGYTEENAPTGTTDIPEAGDSIVLDGSRKDTSRQGVLQLSSYGSGAPSIVGLRGVHEYTHENCATYEFSYESVQILAERFKLIAKDGGSVEITNFRGEWNPSDKYYKNDQVSHNNAIWTCLDDDVWRSEPTDENTAWRKEVYGQKGEDGSSFKVLGTADGHFENYTQLIGSSFAGGKQYLVDDASGFGGTESPSVVMYQNTSGTWYICKSNDGDSYMIGDDLWTNSGSAWLNIGNVKGVSIASTSVTYGVSASGTQQPSSWSSAIPSATDECPYLWTKTVVNYTDGKSTTSYSVSHNGKDGAKGDDGKVGAIFSVDNAWVFDADSNGIVPPDTKKTATIYVARNGKGVNVANAVMNPSRSQNIEFINGASLPMTVKGNAVSITLSGTNISKQQVGDNESDVVSVTSGYLLAAIATEDGDSGVITIPFQVNVAKYTGELTLTNKQFGVSMTEITNRVTTAEGDITGLGTTMNNNMATLRSEISSTAETVKGEVTRQINGELQKAGLEIKADGVTLYGDKITITNDNGKTTTALFSGGKINASLIDVKHLWAISEDGTSKVGYFGNDTDSACVIDDNTTAPLFVGGSTAILSNFYVTSNGKMVAKDAEISGALKGVSGTFEKLTDRTGKLSIGFQDNGFFIEGYTRFYNDVTIDGRLVSQGKDANYLAGGVWARGTFGSYARLTLMCIDNHRYYYEENNTKRVQGSSLGFSVDAIDGHYPYLVSMIPVPSHEGTSDGEESCEYYGASFDLVIIRTTSKSGYYKFTNCGYGKVFHVVNGYGSQTVYIAYQGGWYALNGGMCITMAYLSSSMYTPTSTKAGAGFFVLGSYDNNW